MTLEQIKEKLEYRKMVLRLERFSNYNHGSCEAIGFALYLLKQLEPSWHSYPEERPTEDSIVLVQFDDGHMETQHFIYGDFLWDGNCVRIPVAWMEIPKPYKKEKKNEVHV